MNALAAAAQGTDGNVFQSLLDWNTQIGGYAVHWLEVIGILIGAGSAYLGMKRWVWAWPVGILANVMLFFVYTGAAFGTDTRMPLFGQAGRQIFFIVTSAYGWYRWSRKRRARESESTEPAVTPRWATHRERLAMVAFWIVGTVIAHQVFQAILDANPSPYWTPEWWFAWCDAWVFVGSIVATYAMARAWNEFWLCWIVVDFVGVPFGFATGYVPTAVMYIFYGLFVLYGFVQWVRVTRREQQPATA